MASITESGEIAVNHQPSGGREWVAKLTGTDRKFGYKREFIGASGRNWSSSGKTGCTYFRLTEPGFYEVNEPWKKDRLYYKVTDGKIEEVERTAITFEE